MSDNVTTAYSAALDAFQRTGPKPLHPLARMLGDLAKDDAQADRLLREHLDTAGPDDSLRKQFAHSLARWDHEESDAAWTAGTPGNTAERRAAILARLDVRADTAELITRRFPVALADPPIVIADEWTPWRTPERRVEREFYWAHYRRYLEDTGWAPEAVTGLDTATEEVVGRLCDPTAGEGKAYPARGLVVGHVQSGKTANFTGVIAKAVDAGYRLIIVLTGTTNMLRSQTQRRLDMELCGRENLQAEISPLDSRRHDYQDDPEWISNGFVVHGGLPSDSGHPDIKRLSTHDWDYKLLRQGFPALNFVKHDRGLPLFDPVNLFSSDARLVVAKKNGPVLKSLVTDLGRISSHLSEVPVLIIDDESDQASVNTTSPAKWRAGAKERTSINGYIGQLLSMMVRAQYVGYTATPYANVFIDPSDVQDIFPRDFIVALPRPAGYMGAEDFHDFDDLTPIDERTFANSKEKAHVRFLADEPDPGELRAALDMFVLTGAVKLHRQRMGSGHYRHHTMLVHEAMDRATHREAALDIENLWRKAGYHGPAGMDRLRRLYESDVLPVSRAIEPDALTPADFEDLGPDISAAIDRITPADPGASPVLIVNSDKDLERERENLDFDKRPIWRILVGGNKLARGFTVEGLTVTYYRRATKQVDTLMQMGRWFGFRRGYRDLIRVYTTPDLQEMFAAACLDEEFLRNELRRYSAPAPDGSHLTPRQVPPLIAQHRPDLRPTGRNKMWNAKLVEKSAPGEGIEPVAYAHTESGMLHNTNRWLPLLRRMTQEARFPVPKARTSYGVRYAVVTNRDLLNVIQELRWMARDTFQPELAWLKGLSPEQLSQWVVYTPYQTRTTTLRTVDGEGPISVYTRERPGTGALKVASEERHRVAARHITGILARSSDESDRWDDVYKLAAPATGALILYPTTEAKVIPGVEGGPIDPRSVTFAFHMITPLSAAPKNGKLIKWTTIDNGRSKDLVIDTPSEVGA